MGCNAWRESVHQHAGQRAYSHATTTPTHRTVRMWMGVKVKSSWNGDKGKHSRAEQRRRGRVQRAACGAMVQNSGRVRTNYRLRIL